jgi:hypothetical protein
MPGYFYEQLAQLGHEKIASPYGRIAPSSVSSNMDRTGKQECRGWRSLQTLSETVHHQGIYENKLG